MKATLLLCDAAQVDPAGKVHILGAGWTVVGGGAGIPLPAQAVVAMVHVPWHQTTQPHFLRLRLEDADGNVVRVGPPDAVHPMVHEQTVSVSRPPGAPEGITLDVPVVVSIGPGMPLPAGRYAWRLEIDGASDEDWMATFHVRETA
ncbi:MAG TPA: hypothetical protein VN738_01600 [Acidothermaceae bacterium]|nr:hypothetical protein [Acidothermaceae bacterium]